LDDARDMTTGSPSGSDPEISIIIVNWNTREMTLECLRSVYAQAQGTPFEVILVDNGSHDGSAEAIAAEFPQVRLLAETENHGFGLANNLAAKVARGRRLLLLNSDTLVLDHAIDRLCAFADSRPTARIWGGRTVFGDGSLNRYSAWGKQTVWSVACFAFGLTRLFRNSPLFNHEALGGWGRDTVREVDIVSGCFLLIDTDLWQQLDGFDRAFFMYGEEADLCLRAKPFGARPVCTPEATIVHYGGASAAARIDPTIRIFKGKIELARRQSSALAAWAIRAFYVLAVVMRRIGFSLAALRNPKARPMAEMWRATLSRRAEWL